MHEMKNKGGRPRRTDLYRKVNFHCTDKGDANISFVLGNAQLSGFKDVRSRTDAIELCIDQVSDMMMREQRNGEVIPWKKDAQ